MEGRTLANNELLIIRRSPFRACCTALCRPSTDGETAPYDQGHRHPEGVALHAVNGSTRYPARSVRLRLMGQGIKKAQPTRWRFVRCLGVVIPPQVCAPLWKRPITANGGGVEVTPTSWHGLAAQVRG